MFGHRFFGHRFFGNRYFGGAGSGAGDVDVMTMVTRRTLRNTRHARIRGNW